MGDPRERWQQLQRNLRGSKLPRGPRISGLAGGALLVFGGSIVLSNALFNGLSSCILHLFFWPWVYCAHLPLVDGGHRAIKYTRIGGVQKEIFNEGARYIQPI